MPELANIVLGTEEYVYLMGSGMLSHDDDNMSRRRGYVRNLVPPTAEMFLPLRPQGQHLLQSP